MANRRFCALHIEGDTDERGLVGVAFWCDSYEDYQTDHERIHTTLRGFASDGYTFIAYNAGTRVPVLDVGLGLGMEYTRYSDRFHHASWRWKSRQPLAQFWCSKELSGNMSENDLGLALALPLYPPPQRYKGTDADRYEWKCGTHDRWECEPCYALRHAAISGTYIQRLSATLAGWGAAVSPSLGSIALNVWRCLDAPAAPGRLDSRVAALGRAGYYGARVECLKYGHLGHTWAADTVSAYAAAMVETPMPDPSSLVVFEGISVDALPLAMEGVAEVEVIVPDCHIPPLPYHIGEERCYPVGRLTGTWPLLELRNAVQYGCTITKVYSCVYAQKTLSPFPNFVGTIYALREAYRETNDPRALVAKLLPCALYGRLGSKEDGERTITKPAPAGWSSLNSKRPFDAELTPHGVILTQHDTLSFGGQWTNVLWAAQLTAAMRVKLHHLMLLQGPGLAYCDTDSILSTQPVNGLGEGLGQLVPQGEYQASIIAQPKFYALQNLQGQWQTKGQGMPPNLCERFLRGQVLSHDTGTDPTGPPRHGRQGEYWLPVAPNRGATVYRRQPRNRQSLADPNGWSDTDPLVVGPVADYTPVLTARSQGSRWAPRKRGARSGA